MNLRILALHHTTPDVTSVVTLIQENLLRILSTRTRVHMIWVVYTPDKLDLQKYNNENTTVIDIHDYKNALEIIEKEKPDLIFATADPNFIDYAFSLAGKKLHIPVVSGLLSRTVKRSKTRLLRSYFTGFFESSTNVDTAKSKKKFMRRGIFFIYKYLFLLRTQKAIKMSTLQIFCNFLMLVRVYLSYTGFQLYLPFANTLHWLDSESYLEPALKAGFKRSSLVITGNPMYDPILKIIQEVKPQARTDDKLHVLFLTVGLYEHGFWTRQQRDLFFQQIVSELIKYKDKITLTIKIHPSAEKLADYQELAKSIDPSIQIYQKGDVVNFLKDADVVLCPSTTSAIEYALLLKKPIVICNFSHDKGHPFLERGLALECNESSTLKSCIDKVLESNPATSDKVEEYIKDFLYKVDGKSSERLCDAILQLIEK